MTTYTKIVDPGGSGDYTSLAAWEAAEQTLYSSGDIAVAVCRRTTSTVDTSRLIVAGWTTGVIPKITVDDNYRHEGLYANTRSDNGNYVYILRAGFSTWACIEPQVTGTSIDGLVMTGLSDASPLGGGVNIGAYGSIVISNCIFTKSNKVGVYASYALAGCEIFNCLFSDLTNYATNVDRNFLVANCDSYNTRGFNGGTRTPYPAYYNCYSGSPVSGYSCYQGTANSSSNKNVSSDSSAPGTNVATLKTAYSTYFADYANGDFHLTDTGLNLFGISGTNMSAYFTTDFDGDTRSAWDIGPDEYVSTGPEPVINIVALIASKPTRIIQ